LYYSCYLLIFRVVDIVRVVALRRVMAFGSSGMLTSSDGNQFEQKP
jgi:hypothetical protein